MTRFAETIRDLLVDAPMSNNNVRDSFVVITILLCIFYGARYITTLQRLFLHGTDLQPGSSSSTGSSLMIDSEGRIIVVATPLALVMGCNLVVIAVF